MINETGLNGNEYVEVPNGYAWLGKNRDWEDGKSGGVGIILKESIEYEVYDAECKDVIFIKIAANGGKMNWILGNIYLHCEGVNFEANKEKMECVRRVSERGEREGMKVMIGGDMNGHIWELDGRGK